MTAATPSQQPPAVNAPDEFEAIVAAVIELPPPFPPVPRLLVTSFSAVLCAAVKNGLTAAGLHWRDCAASWDGGTGFIALTAARPMPALRQLVQALRDGFLLDHCAIVGWYDPAEMIWRTTHTFDGRRIEEVYHSELLTRMRCASVQLQDEARELVRLFRSIAKSETPPDA